MQLKISSITNLTDARFFSAVGAHYLGFCFDVLNENNITLSKAKEIIAWLHEPVITGEFGIHQTKEEIQFIAGELQLNEIQIPFNHPDKEELSFQKFLWLEQTSTDIKDSDDFFIVRIREEQLNDQVLKKFISSHKVFIETTFTKENILPLLERLQPYGIQLTCKKEEHAGLSAVDEYAEILELIGFG